MTKYNAEEVLGAIQASDGTYQSVADTLGVVVSTAWKWINDSDSLKAALTVVKRDQATLELDQESKKVEHELFAELPEASDLPESGIYVITAAVSCTPVNQDWLNCLQGYCEEREAELMVVPIRYNNPTSQFYDKDTKDTWAREVLPYIYTGRQMLGEQFLVLGDMKIQATSPNPLGQLDSITGSVGTIVAHPQIHQRTVPTPQNEYAKILATTGAVTDASYSDTSLGKRAEHNHRYAAVVVEVCGDTAHLRHLIWDADSSTMQDLTDLYDESGLAGTSSIEALIMGDTHVRNVDPTVMSATNAMMDRLQPRHLVWHDLLDGDSVNPHEAKNPFAKIAKHSAGMANAEDELQEAADFLGYYANQGFMNHVIGSNHNDFLTRWISDTDWKDDPENAIFYLETALEMAKSAKMQDGGWTAAGAWKMWMQRMTNNHENITYPGQDEGFRLCNYELGYHGHKGINGARGNINSFSKVGTKMIIGHSHSPGRRNGCIQVGTSTHLSLSYTSGLSSWANAHAVLYPNGKSTLIFIHNGEWCA